MASVAIGTAVAAVSGYLILFLAARELGPAGYASFSVFWALFFGLAGALSGIMQESTRAVRSNLDAESAPADPARTRAANPLRVALAIGSVVAALALATSPLWATWLLHDSVAVSLCVLTVGLWAFAGHSAVAGALSGQGAWNRYSALLIGDALARLAGVVIALLFGAPLTGFIIATGLGGIAWMVLIVASGQVRHAIGLRADVPTGEFVRRSLHAMAATAASAALVMGFPVLLQATSHGSLSSEAGVVILAVTLTRAPLLVPLNAFQGALISYFVQHRADGVKALRTPGLALLGLGLVGAGLAAAFGPWLLRLGFGAEYEAGRVLMAALTLGACGVALLTMTGAATLAVEQHRGFAAGWWLATLASVVVLALPIDLQLRTSAALIAGPAVGCLFHIVAVYRAR